MTTMTRSRTTSPAAAAKATEVLGRLAEVELRKEDARRGRERAEAWSALEKLRADREAALAPLRRAADAARAALEPAQVELNQLRGAWASAANDLARVEADLDARQSGLERRLRELAPAVLGRLKVALHREWVRTLQQPVRIETVIDRDEQGNARLTDDGRAKRVTLSPAEQIAARAKQLLDAYRECDALVTADPAALEKRLHELADLAGVDLDDLPEE
jgi:hypothetical protein